jgi:hypothetical protein
VGFFKEQYMHHHPHMLFQGAVHAPPSAHAVLANNISEEGEVANNKERQLRHLQ